MTGAITWLEPLRASVPDINQHGWQALDRLEASYRQRCAQAPDACDRVAWSRWLRALRRDLAHHVLTPSDGPTAPVWQTLAQFIAGFHDLDLRDAVGAGHGSMIITHAVTSTRSRWQARLQQGDLVGIAASERHGGSRIQEITTRAHVRRDGTWQVTGEKCWVSRLMEAAGFVVFFRDPDGRISAAVIDADNPRLHRQHLEPHGLGGWSWGVLRLDAVAVDPTTELLGSPGDGLRIFRDHFTRFRPLVTATAVGTAAGVHTMVAEILAAKTSIGVLPRIRDTALVCLGRTHAEITAALLAAIHASRLAALGHPDADLTARLGKAAGVDTANRAVADLAPLIGAAGYQRTHPIAKARADLAGLLYADGIHDSLYRSGGTTLLDTAHRGATIRSLPHASDAAQAQRSAA